MTSLSLYRRIPRDARCVPGPEPPNCRVRQLPRGAPHTARRFRRLICVQRLEPKIRATAATRPLLQGDEYSSGESPSRHLPRHRINSAGALHQQRSSRMQGTIARGPKLHRSTATCARPAVLLLRFHVPPRSRRGKWCVTAAAAGDGARGVARGERRLADERPEGKAGRRAPSGGCGSKRGSVAGAVALIVGTSIGSGILAVPQRTAPAGFVPSAACMVTCWAFLVAEALLLAEINVHMRRRRNKDGDTDSRAGEGDLDVISVKSMAQETLGEWGGHVATAAYLFLSYTSMVAYASKSGEVLSRLVDVPEPVSGGAFTAALALLIAAGGTGVTDRVNQLVTFVMIGLLLTIEVSAVAFGGGLSLPANSNWEQVPAALPVIIFTLVFHDMAPVICAYLGGDLARIRLSILVGSLVPLLSLLVWDDIALGVATDLHGFDILEILKTEWSYTLVETFSLLAVGTSLIGTLLGASQFFIEQMTILASPAAAQGHVCSTGTVNKGTVAFPKDRGSKFFGVDAVLEKNRLSYIATALVAVPTMVIAATVPDSFSIAIDIAGGYCMTILYGVLPPLMAWRIVSKRSDSSSAIKYEEASKYGKGKLELTNAKPVLVAMGVFSVVMVFEQIFQDLSTLNTSLVS